MAVAMRKEKDLYPRFCFLRQMAAQKPAVTMLPTGERIIAATRRKDGTMRKEVKVRAGWVTEELDERARVYRKQIQVRLLIV